MLTMDAARLKRLRRRLGLSQRAFAQTYRIGYRNIRNWEQGIREPRGPARTLLLIIEKEPDVVARVLAPRRKRKA